VITNLTVQLFKTQWLTCVLPGLAIKNSTFCPLIVWIWE